VRVGLVGPGEAVIEGQPCQLQVLGWDPGSSCPGVDRVVSRDRVLVSEVVGPDVEGDLGGFLFGGCFWFFTVRRHVVPGYRNQIPGFWNQIPGYPGTRFRDGTSFRRGTWF